MSNRVSAKSRRRFHASPCLPTITPEPPCFERGKDPHDIVFYDLLKKRQQLQQGEKFSPTPIVTQLRYTVRETGREGGSSCPDDQSLNPVFRWGKIPEKGMAPLGWMDGVCKVSKGFPLDVAYPLFCGQGIKKSLARCSGHFQLGWPNGVYGSGGQSSLNAPSLPKHVYFGTSEGCGRGQETVNDPCPTEKRTSSALTLFRIYSQASGPYGWSLRHSLCPHKNTGTTTRCCGHFLWIGGQANVVRKWFQNVNVL
ncbi:hypothetical protein CEXT_698141 [Caerostris extrusa]|uniref:Uncharacterized protein n=1 Tax=Caerostris extrusa TaxID=172846 RepID=A0AAV4RZV6_CAEEX|nr:hypothetical protein CEXT_698141 [Caerostris extrusa]